MKLKKIVTIFISSLLLLGSIGPLIGIHVHHDDDHSSYVLHIHEAIKDTIGSKSITKTEKHVHDYLTNKSIIEHLLGNIFLFRAKTRFSENKSQVPLYSIEPLDITKLIKPYLILYEYLDNKSIALKPLLYPAISLRAPPVNS